MSAFLNLPFELRTTIIEFYVRNLIYTACGLFSPRGNWPYDEAKREIYSGCINLAATSLGIHDELIDVLRCIVRQTKSSLKTPKAYNQAAGAELSLASLAHRKLQLAKAQGIMRGSWIRMQRSGTLEESCLVVRYNTTPPSAEETCKEVVRVSDHGPDPEDSVVPNVGLPQRLKEIEEIMRQAQ